MSREHSNAGPTKLRRNDYFQKSLYLRVLSILLVAFGGFYAFVYAVLGFVRVLSPNNMSHFFSRSLYYSLRALGFPQVRLTGRKDIPTSDGSKIFVGNHQTNWDIVIYAKMVPHKTYVLGKRELLKIPIFGQFFYLAGNFLIDRSSKEAGKKCIEAMNRRISEKKHSLFVFPEGTRNKDLNVLLQPFKIGAFKIAKDTGAPIAPIVALVPPRGRPSTVCLDFLEPINPNDFTDAESLMKYTHNVMQQHLKSYLERFELRP